MLVYEGVRSFQQHMTKYINGDDVVIIEDAKTHKEKGVFLPFSIYEIFKEQINNSVREDIKRSFVESFDGPGVVSDH